MSRILHRHLRHMLPLAVGGHGIRIVDAAGKEYLDAPGGAAVSCLGHGLTTMVLPDGVQIAAVNKRSAADKAGVERDFMVTGIEVLAPRPAQEWLFLPALAVLGGIVLLQRRRIGATDQVRPAAQGA